MSKNPRSGADVWLRSAYLLCAFALLLSIVAYKSSGPAKYLGYWTSGRAAEHRLNPYAIYPVTNYTDLEFQGTMHRVYDVNLNPPCVVLVLQLMSHMPLEEFGRVWFVCSTLCLLGSIGLIMSKRRDIQMRQLFWLLLSMMVLDTLGAGQIYLLLLLLSTISWWAFENQREVSASLAMGLLIAIKPTLILVPLFSYLARQRRFAALSLAFTGIASLLPLAIYPVRYYTDWLSTLRADNHWLFPTIAIPAYFSRLQLRGLGFAVSAVILIFLCFLVWRSRPSWTTTTGIAVCAAILCAPLSWAAYILMLAPMYVSQRWNKLEKVPAVMLMIPVAVPYLLLEPLHAGLFAVATFDVSIGVLVLVCFVQRARREVECEAKMQLDAVVTVPAF